MVGSKNWGRQGLAASALMLIVVTIVCLLVPAGTVNLDTRFPACHLTPILPSSPWHVLTAYAPVTEPTKGWTGGLMRSKVLSIINDPTRDWIDGLYCPIPNLGVIAVPAEDLASGILTPILPSNPWHVLTAYAPVTEPTKGWTGGLMRSKVLSIINDPTRDWIDGLYCLTPNLGIIGETAEGLASAITRWIGGVAPPGGVGSWHAMWHTT